MKFDSGRLFLCSFWLFVAFSVILRSNSVQNTFQPTVCGNHVSWQMSNVGSHSFRLYHSLLLHPSVCKIRHFSIGNPHSQAVLLLLAGDISTNPGPVQQPSLLKISCANVRSLFKHAASVRSFVDDVRPHCLLLTETWLKPDCTDAHLRELTPEGYRLMHRCRQVGESVSKRAKRVVALVASLMKGLKPISFPPQTILLSSISWSKLILVRFSSISLLSIVHQIYPFHNFLSNFRISSQI